MKRVVSDPEWPLASSGMLTIAPEQVAALTDWRRQSSTRRTISFLREAAPDEVGGKTDRELSTELQGLRASGASLGLEGERAQAWWAYLMISTKGEVGQQQTVRADLSNGPGKPDDRMERLKDYMVFMSRSDRGRG